MDERSAAVSAEVARCLGLPRVELQPAPAGGAAHVAYQVVDPSAPEHPVAFLRMEGAFAGQRYGLRREAAVLPVAASIGLPVPQVFGTPGEPPGLLMNVVPGTSRPDPAEIEAVAAEYLGLIGRLHGADPTAFPVEQFATVHDAVIDDLGWWERYAEETGALAEPIVLLGARVLRATVPQVFEPPTLLHGDVGAGNFMVDHGRLTGLLDWELAHVGDPHEDLAWLWMRGAHTSFGDPRRRLTEYVSATGRPIVTDRLRWHVGLVMWKSSVGTYARLRQPADDAAFVQSMVVLTYDALLGGQLLRLLGGSLRLLDQHPVRRPTPVTLPAERMLEARVLDKQERLVLSYLRDAAAQAQWERDELGEDSYRAGLTPPYRLMEAIEQAGADRDQLLALTMVIARAADRAAMALPNAVRRIERAQRIGLGTIDNPMDDPEKEHA